MIETGAAEQSRCRRVPGLRRVPALATLVVAVSSALAEPGAAQIQADPMNVVLRLLPDQPRLGLITIRNESDSAIQVDIRLEDWDRADDGTNQWYPLGTVPGSCGQALRIFPPTVNLEPGASHAVRLTFDPDTILQRECWAAAVAEIIRPPRGRGGVEYVIRTAAKVYVRPPDLAASGEVESLGLVAPPDSGASRPGVEMLFANTGAGHLEGTAEVRVRTPDNRTLHTIPFPRLYVLPGARMKVRAALPDLPSGRYVLLAVVDYGGAELAAAQIEYHVP